MGLLKESSGEPRECLAPITDTSNQGVGVKEGCSGTLCGTQASLSEEGAAKGQACGSVSNRVHYCLSADNWCCSPLHTLRVLGIWIKQWETCQ